MYYNFHKNASITTKLKNVAEISNCKLLIVNGKTEH